MSELSSERVDLHLEPYLVRLEGGLLTVHLNDGERCLWASHPEQPLVRAAHGVAHVTESRGFFQVNDRCERFIDGGPIDRFERLGDQVIVAGVLGSDARWSMTFSVIDEVQLHVSVTTDRPNLNRLQLVGAAAVDERVFGLGEQFTVLNMKGRKVPILSQEPGIGVAFSH